MQNNTSQATPLPLQLLKIDTETLPHQTSIFIEMLAALVTDPRDVTGLNVANLRMAAQSLKMDYERIDGLLAHLEAQYKPSDEQEGK